MAKADTKKIRTVGNDNDVFTALLALAAGTLIATLGYGLVRGSELYGEYLDFGKLFG